LNPRPPGPQPGALPAELHPPQINILNIYHDSRILQQKVALVNKSLISLLSKNGFTAAAPSFAKATARQEKDAEIEFYQNF
jgi:hypothetical protein